MKRAFLSLLAFFFAIMLCCAQSNEFENLKATIKNPSDSLKYVDALNRMAMLQYERNIDSTFHYTVKARTISDRLKYAKGKADATNNLGIFFDIKGNMQLALRYYDEAYISYKKLNDSANIVQSMMNIAMVYKQMGKDDKSIQRYTSAMELGKKLSKDSIMSLAIFNYLLQFPNKFDKQQNNELINKAKQIAVKYKDDRTLLAIEQIIADKMIDEGRSKEGLLLLQKSITKAIDKKMFYMSMDMLVDLGDRLSVELPDSAAIYYQKALTIANSNGYLIYSSVLARKLFELYSTQHNNVLAAKYAKQLTEIIDKQQELDTNSGIDYIDYALKDQELQSLLSRSKYQTTISILSIITCILAIIITISIRQNLKRSRKENQLSVQRNNIMQKTLNALQQSQEDNTRMMKIAAHDLRNPLGGIFSLTSLMLEEPDRSEDDREILETIKISSQHSLTLVKDLLEVQFDTADFKKEPVEVAELLSYCITLLQRKAEDKEQLIELNSFELTISANREKLWRVVSNLISNAIKFSPTNSTISIGMKSDLKNLTISVKDHGIGIPAAIKSKIFEMFTTAKRHGTGGEEPFGLGLAISKQIVESHHGNIWFENTPQGGTTFYVSLPIN